MDHTTTKQATSLCSIDASLIAPPRTGMSHDALRSEVLERPKAVGRNLCSLEWRVAANLEDGGGSPTLLISLLVSYFNIYRWAVLDHPWTLLWCCLAA